MKRTGKLDIIAEASGISKKQAKELEKYMREVAPLEANEETDEDEDDDEEEGEDEEGEEEESVQDKKDPIYTNDTEAQKRK